MCGIGLVFGNSQEEVSVVLSSFLLLQAHRGPDDFGTHVLSTGSGRKLGFAHRRLSVIDLSSGGHQPMVDEFGNVIIFNGEIYNYLELASELKGEGERFRATSDTEVILKGYRRWGHEKLLEKIRGMFAFSIWDNERQKLFLVRDPMGIKPLYYTEGVGGAFACASEAKALVGAGCVDGTIDLSGFDSFLAYGSVAAPLTIWRGIKMLLPGCYLWVEADGRVGEFKRYWTWRSDENGGGVEAISGRLRKSIERHLVSDVPVGLFLSGGYDSAALAALTSKISDTPIHTFTVSFPDNKEYSEGDAARVIAKRFNTTHHDISVRESEVLAKLPRFFKAMDQPSEDGLNSLLVSEAAAGEGIKACLHGVGGDELFGGYPSFQDVPKAVRVAVIPAPVRKFWGRLIKGYGLARGKIGDLLLSDGSVLETFMIRRRVFSFEQRRDLLGQTPPLGKLGLPEEWLSWLKFSAQTAPDMFAAISRLELLHYAGNKLLLDGDVMSMANSLEIRFPFLDLDLCAVVLGTHASEKRKRGYGPGKPALVKATPEFPVDLMGNRKIGFTLPIARWMLKDLNTDCREVLLGGELSGILHPKGLAEAWKRFLGAPESNEWLRAWTLFSAARWLDARGHPKISPIGE